VKKAIYTALIGNYDKWSEPKYTNPDFDYYLFTDQPIISKAYRVIKVPKAKHNRRLAREIKILAYKYLPNYDITIWHDANLVQHKDLSCMLNWTYHDIVTLRHPTRNCIYDEADACAMMNKDSHAAISKQMRKYEQKNYPQNNGLVATGIIVRKNTYNVNLFCNNWHTELKNGSFRDQLSFNYVLSKHGIKVKKISFENIHKYFKYKQHN
jgi:hypothetical protein